MYRTLPIYRSVQFTRSQSFEANHQAIKAVTTKARGVGDVPEVAAMKRIIELEAIQYVMCGGRWGSMQQFQAGSSLLSVADIQTNKMHPMLQHILGSKENFDNWTYTTKCYQQSVLDTTRPSHSSLQNIDAVLNPYFPDIKDVLFQPSTSFVWVKGVTNNGIKYRVGSDIKINFNGDVEYIQIQGCLMIHTPQHQYYFLIYPLWYEKIHNTQ